MALTAPEGPHPFPSGWGRTCLRGVSKPLGRETPPPLCPPCRGGARGRGGAVTGGDAGPARSYRGAPRAQGPCFAAAAASPPTRAAAHSFRAAAASVLRATAMREIVHLQAGQCGNQIGAKVRGTGPGGRPTGCSGAREPRGAPHIGTFGARVRRKPAPAPGTVGEGRKGRARLGTKRPMAVGPSLLSAGHSWLHSWPTVPSTRTKRLRPSPQLQPERADTSRLGWGGDCASPHPHCVPHAASSLPAHHASRSPIHVAGGRWQVGRWLGSWAQEAAVGAGPSPSPSLSLLPTPL